MRSGEAKAKAEAEFHNIAYQAGIRKSISPAYELMADCSRFYRNFLKARCENQSILEFGCGENSVAPFLMKNGAQRVVGIDISDVAVHIANQGRAGFEGGERVQYRVMNAESLDYDDNTFDLVCGIAILHHLDLTKAYSEISRTLRPGGAAIFLEPLAYNPAINLYRRFTPQLRTEDEHPLTMAEIGMAGQYFERVESEYFNLFSLAAVPCARTRIFPHLRHVLGGLDRDVFSAAPFMRRYAWTASMALSNPRNKAASPDKSVDGGRQ